MPHPKAVMQINKNIQGTQRVPGSEQRSVVRTRLAPYGSEKEANSERPERQGDQVLRTSAEPLNPPIPEA